MVNLFLDQKTMKGVRTRQVIQLVLDFPIKLNFPLSIGKTKSKRSHTFILTLGTDCDLVKSTQHGRFVIEKVTLQVGCPLLNFTI